MGIFQVRDSTGFIGFSKGLQFLKDKTDRLWQSLLGVGPLIPSWSHGLPVWPYDEF